MIDSQFPRVKCYDNGGKSTDRYTVVFLDDPQNRKGLYGALAMNEIPFHPQGFGQHCSAMLGKHLGKRIDSSLLPADCQKLIRQDLGLPAVKQ
jgi:hypothetical protein